MTGLVLKINDRFITRKVEFFNDFSVTLSHNAVASTFGFSFYFDPNNIEHREISTPSHYHIATLEFNGILVLTGQILSSEFTQQSTKVQASISGYSLPGVLEDCQIPPSIYPLQSNGLSLAQIARKLLRPFKLEMSIDDSVSDRINKSFTTSTASSTQTVKSYLSTLAAQKDIIMSSTPEGALAFTQSKLDQDPILKFDLTSGMDSIPGTSFRHKFDGQKMHSHITAMRQASISGGNAGQSTVRNPYVIGTVFRPKVVTQSSGDDNDTNLAARRERANELRGVTLKITTDRWIVNGDIIKHNNIITIIAPELYLYRKERWFIESVELNGDNKQTTATLNCVLPEVYNNEDPVNIFRNLNLHSTDAQIATIEELDANANN